MRHWFIATPRMEHVCFRCGLAEIDPWHYLEWEGRRDGPGA